MLWKVQLWGIRWDDGKGEYDVSELPDNVEIYIEADTEDQAREYALIEASDAFGSLIDGTVQIDARRG